MKIETDKLLIKITDAISTVTALKVIIIIIVSWLIFGQLSGVDKFPFMFSSTITNYSGFILTIVILISTKALEKLQKEAAERDKIMQEQHYKIQAMEARLVDHMNKTQDQQNEILAKIAEKMGVES